MLQGLCAWTGGTPRQNTALGFWGEADCWGYGVAPGGFAMPSCGRADAVGQESWEQGRGSEPRPHPRAPLEGAAPMGALLPA